MMRYHNHTAKMKKNIEIQGRTIGQNQNVFIIAEAGINHNGSLDTAKILVREAKHAGADCVKFQTFKASRVVTTGAPKASYQEKTTSPHESQLEMLNKAELSYSDFQELITYCRDQNILFLSTPYNIEDVDFLNRAGVAAFKLASIHIVEPLLLHYVARTDKPLILSTGMATLAEIDEAVRTIHEAGNDKLILLQCTTNYPSRIDDANLRTIPMMRRAFDCIVGYSDHTQTDTAAIVAVTLGACVVEKHFTVDKTLSGPDHSCSTTPSELKQLVSSIREAESALGSERKSPTQAERKNACGMRRSIVARHTIRSGEKISIDNIIFKRPATGIPPRMLPYVLGRKAAHLIEEDTMLDWSDLAQIAKPIHA